MLANQNITAAITIHCASSMPRSMVAGRNRHSNVITDAWDAIATNAMPYNCRGRSWNTPNRKVTR